ATGTFTVQQPHGPSVGPMPELLILGSQEDPDSNRVTLSVTFTNTGSEPLADPDGVALFDFTSATGPPPVNRMPCAAPVQTLPEAPPGSCVRDHRGTPGFDAILAPGERSGAVPWAFEQFSGNDFMFHARVLDLLDPGEIAGTIFRDLNGNGVRDPGEPGLAGDVVAVTFPESIHAQPADALGRFSIRVAAPGTYPVRTFIPDCCPTNAMQRAVEITHEIGQPLSAVGGVDFGCSTVVGGRPSVVHLGVRGETDAVLCVGAAPCTVATFTSFRVRFSGASSCRSIA